MFTVHAAACGAFSFGPCNTVTLLLAALRDSFFAVVWVLAIVFLAYGGLLYITSAGDKTKAEKAQGALTNALIGIVILLGMQVIIGLVGSLLSGGASFAVPSIGASIPSI